jgi:hypothetical protein
MQSREKRIDKLQMILERLSRGEIVQNRQLQTVLGTEGYARYLSDCEYQKHLRTTLKDKPGEIVEYERRLKAATFAYSNADSKSRKGRSRAATKMFGASDTQFERLSEYLSENIIGHPELEAWFDRPLAAALVLAHKTGDTIYVASRAAQTIYDRGGSTRLIPWLDKLVKAGLLLSASRLNRAEGSMKLGPLLEMYLK